MPPVRYGLPSLPFKRYVKSYSTTGSSFSSFGITSPSRTHRPVRSVCHRLCPRKGFARARISREARIGGSDYSNRSEHPSHRQEDSHAAQGRHLAPAGEPSTLGWSACGPSPTNAPSATTPSNSGGTQAFGTYGGSPSGAARSKLSSVGK